MSATAKKEQAAASPSPSSRSPRPKVFAAIRLAVIVLGMLILRRPAALPPEAGVRAAMATAATRLQAFQAEHGRPARSAPEIGALPEGVYYRVVDGTTWELRAPRGADTLVLRTGDDVNAFARDTAEPGSP